MESVPTKPKVNISFSGCGFMSAYYVGVGSCLLEHEDEFDVQTVAGASAGAITAVIFLCKIPIGNLDVSRSKIAFNETDKTITNLESQ